MTSTQRTIGLGEIQEASERVNGKALTIRQAFFVKGVMEHKNPPRASKEAYSIGSKHLKGQETTEKQINKIAASMATENLHNPVIERTIHEIGRDLGLTKEFLVQSLVQDIKGKKKKRARELELGGKWLGLDQSGEQTTNNIVIMGLEQAERLLSRRNDGLPKPLIE